VRVKITTLDDKMQPVLSAYVYVEARRVRLLTWGFGDGGASFKEELEGGVVSADGRRRVPADPDFLDALQYQYRYPTFLASSPETESDEEAKNLSRSSSVGTEHSSRE